MSIALALAIAAAAVVAAMGVMLVARRLALRAGSSARPSRITPAVHWRRSEPDSRF